MILNKIIKDWLEKIPRKIEYYKLGKSIREIYQKTPNEAASGIMFSVERTGRRPRYIPVYRYKIISY